MEQNKQPIPAERDAAIRITNTQPSYDDEIDLLELFFTFLRRWKLFLLGAVVGALVALGFYAVYVHPKYQAATEMYITNTDSVISLSDLQLGSALTEDYKFIITSRAVLNKVIEELKLDANYKKLQRMVKVSNPSGTHVIRTVVTADDENSCRIIANELLNVSIERIFQVIGTSEPTIIDHSEADAVENVTPSKLLFALAGAAAGIGLVAAFIIIRVMTDTTLKNEEDVEKYLKLPLLASVPFFQERTDNKKNKGALFREQSV